MLSYFVAYACNQDAVVDAPALRGRGVFAAGRASRRGDVRAVEQAVAFAAPSPITLTGRIGDAVGQAVVGAAALSGRGVGAAGGTSGQAQVRTEEQALALIAPAPLTLSAVVTRLVAQ